MPCRGPAGRASGNAQLNFIRTCPLPCQRRVRQLANKIMLLIQKLEEKKQYLMKLILGMFISELPRLHHRTRSLRLVAFLKDPKNIQTDGLTK
jgi:hypothetical protein